MKNFLIKLSYNGSAYHGWQRQKNAYTVEQAVEEALYILTGQDICVNGCSRTDAGVHAREYYASFTVDSPIDERGIIFGLNPKLPDDIAVLDCKEVAPDFHARYRCKGKEYEYIVHNSRIKNPFYKDTAYRTAYPIDAELINKSAQDLVGEHDFKAFCSTACEKENTVRNIKYFKVHREGEFVVFNVLGDGFLYNMVRIMVGTLLFINDGKIKADAIPDIIRSKDRKKAGKTVPPQGLYLNKVFYDEVF